VGVGIGAVGAGVSFALRCANGTPIEKITACGGPAEVGYVLGGIFASLGITGIIVGAATTGNRTVTDHEQLGQAADFLRFVPQLAFEFGKQGTIAQAQWSF
jgi:hypothetical protein